MQVQVWQMVSNFARGKDMEMELETENNASGQPRSAGRGSALRRLMEREGEVAYHWSRGVVLMVWRGRP